MTAASEFFTTQAPIAYTGAQAAHPLSFRWYCAQQCFMPNYQDFRKTFN